MPFVRLIFLFVFLIHSAFAKIDQEQFADDFQRFRDNGSEVPSESAVSRHSKTKFILMTGLAGEYIPLYWSDTRRELERLTGTRGEKDPAQKRVFVIKPSSGYGLLANADYIKTEVDKIVRLSPPDTRFVLVGHSKSAVETWTLVMKHPEFSSEKIAAAIFLQGPYGGSPLATHIAENHSPGIIEPFWNNPALFAFRWMMLKAYQYPPMRPGLLAITPEAATQHVQSIQEAYGSGHSKEISEKTLFMTTFSNPLTGIKRFLPTLNNAMSICVKTLASLSPGSSDGMVKLAHQSPPGSSNRSIVVPDLHHGQVAQSSLGKAFAKALFGSIQ